VPDGVRHHLADDEHQVVDDLVEPEQSGALGDRPPGLARPVRPALDVEPQPEGRTDRQHVERGGRDRVEVGDAAQVDEHPAGGLGGVAHRLEQRGRVVAGDGPADGEDLHAVGGLLAQEH
jgi:hypothetical protein